MSQRSFITQLHETIEKRTPNHIKMFIGGGPVITPEIEKSLEQRFFIGSPGLRTLWQVQSVSITFSAEILNEEAKRIAKFPFNLVVNLFAGNIIQAVNIITLPVPEPKEVGRVKELIGNKTYILELFSPITLSKAEPLEIGLFVEGKIEHFPAKAAILEATLENVMVNTVINQDN